MDRTPDIEILGIKIYFPNNWFTLAGFVILLSFIAYMSYLLFTNNAEIRINGHVYSFGRVGKHTSLKEGFMLGFWTPSEETKKSYMKCDTSSGEWIYLDNVDSSAYSWQCKPKAGSDFKEANEKFAKRIRRNMYISGYRRYEVTGEGEHKNKPKKGWWWEVSVHDAYDDQFTQDFKDLYNSFWDPDTEWDNVYMEVVGKQKKSD